MRYPRARFTRALQKICSALEASPILEVTDKDFRGRTRQTRVQIRTLWVVGSYARGALECGDLDLVLDVVGLNGGVPRIQDISRCFFGATPRVAFYHGTPEKNQSGVEFSDARLVWSSEHPDWRSSIASIAEDPTAGHFERPSDHLPLSPEQMRGDISHVEKLLHDRNERRLSWYHIDLEADHRAQPQIPEQFAETLSRYTNMGKATRHALAHFLAASGNRQWADEELNRNWGAPTEFRLGGTEIHVGTPPLPYEPLAVASTSRLVLVPHMSARGPNRAWVIERDIGHPLMQLAESRKAYTLAYSGKPIEVHIAESAWSWMSMLELFTSYNVAETFAKEMDECDASVDPEGFEPTQVLELSGEALLASIARVEQIQIVLDPSEDREIFNVRDFRRYDIDHQVLFNKLMALLPRRHAPASEPLDNYKRQ